MTRLCFMLFLLYIGKSEGDTVPCGSKADVIFLLDSSQSIGIEKIPKLKSFIKGVVEYFDVGENKVQIGLTSFSTSVRTDFHLNTFKTKQDVLKAIENVKFIGENTNTGQALSHVTENEFTAENGHRAGVPKVIVLITDGHSSNFNKTREAAKKANESGIHTFAVGINIYDNSSLQELMTVASKTEYIYTVFGYELAYHEAIVSSRICKMFSEHSNCRKIHNADIMFLLDSSGGVGQANFTRIKNFVKDIIKKFTVGSKHVQFGVVTFSTFAKNVFKLSDYNNTADMEKALDNMNFSNGESHSHLGLRYLRQHSFTAQSGARDGNVDKIAIVVTDGFSNMRNETTNEANKLKETGVKVFAINVGAVVDLAELNSIASSDEGDETKYVFKSLTFDVLEELEPLVLKMVCVKANLPSCMGKADVVFLLDSSCSIGKDNFSKMKQFVKQVTHEFYVHKEGIQVGVETFECKSHPLLKLNSLHNKVYIKHKISGMRYTPGGTNTGQALENLRKISFTKQNGLRNYVKKIGIVITDGDSKSKSKTFYEAHNARLSGITLIAVGVGVEDTTEITGIANRADARVESYRFLAKDYESLLPLAKNVSSIVCSV